MKNKNYREPMGYLETLSDDESDLIIDSLLSISNICIQSFGNNKEAIQHSKDILNLAKKLLRKKIYTGNRTIER